MRHAFPLMMFVGLLALSTSVQAQAPRVGDKVYVTDEEGEVAIFVLSADPDVAIPKEPGGNLPLAEINMGQSINCSPIYANGTLYVATKGRLFAIQNQGTEATGYCQQ